MNNVSTPACVLTVIAMLLPNPVSAQNGLGQIRRRLEQLGQQGPQGAGRSRSAPTIPIAPGGADQPLTGVYTGDYTCSSTLIPLRLTIVAQPDGALTGDFAFRAPSGAPGGLKESVYSLKGQYTASSGAFRMTPDRWLTAGPIGYQMDGVEGVFDAGRDTLAGKISSASCGEFRLSRDVKASTKVRQQSSSAAEQMRNLRPGAIASGRQPESCQAITVWSSRFRQEYPTQDVEHTPLDLQQILNLFEDEYFTRFFGKPYDRMSERERLHTGRQMSDCFISQRYRASFTWETMLERPFTLPAGDFSASQVLAGVAERRRIRQNFQETVAKLSGLPANPDSFDQAIGWDKHGSQTYVILWPSELKAFREAVQDAKRRTAESALVARVTAAIGGASDSGAIAEIERLTAASGELFTFAGPDVAQREQARMAAALQQRLAALMPAEKKKVEAFGSGLAAVEHGAAWYSAFDSTYRRYFADPSVADVLARFTERREQDLRAASPQLKSAIASGRNEGDVNAVLARYIVAPDGARQNGAAIVRAAADRRQALALERELAKFSERERKLMGPNNVVQVPARYSPPTEREIALAALRAFATQGEILGPDTASTGVAPLQKLFPLTVEVKRVALAPKSCAASSDGGFECGYRIWLHLSAGANTRQIMGNSPQGAMLEGLYTMVNNTEPQVKTDRFVLTSSGWRSPTLQTQMLNNTLRFWGNFGNAMKSAGCASRKARRDPTVWSDPRCQ